MAGEIGDGFNREARQGYYDHHRRPPVIGDETDTAESSFLTIVNRETTET